MGIQICYRFCYRKDWSKSNTRGLALLDWNLSQLLCVQNCSRSCLSGRNKPPRRTIASYIRGRWKMRDYSLFTTFTVHKQRMHNNRQSQEHPLLLQPQVLCTSTWVCYYCSSHAIFHNEGGQIASGGSQLGWARLVSSRRGNRKCANQLLLKSIL